MRHLWKLGTLHNISRENKKDFTQRFMPNPGGYLEFWRCYEYDKSADKKLTMS